MVHLFLRSSSRVSQSNLFLCLMLWLAATHAHNNDGEEDSHSSNNKHFCLFLESEFFLMLKNLFPSFVLEVLTSIDHFSFIFHFFCSRRTSICHQVNLWLLVFPGMSCLIFIFFWFKFSIIFSFCFFMLFFLVFRFLFGLFFLWFFMFWFWFRSWFLMLGLLVMYWFRWRLLMLGFFMVNWFWWRFLVFWFFMVNRLGWFFMLWFFVMNWSRWWGLMFWFFMFWFLVLWFFMFRFFMFFLFFLSKMLLYMFSHMSTSFMGRRSSLMIIMRCHHSKIFHFTLRTYTHFIIGILTSLWRLFGLS